MTLEREFAQTVALAIKSATAPLLAEIADLRASARVTQEAWSASLGELQARLAAVQERAPIPGPVGPQGPAGEPGARGEKGEPGLSLKGDPGERGERGEKGLDGVQGQQGLDGKDGANGLNGKDGADAILPDLDLLAQKAAALVPLPKDGRDGLPGVPGRPGEKGSDGLNGKDGADGLHGKDGANGLNGKDGADGLGFEEQALVFDDTKGYLWRFKRGDLVRDFPAPGVWDAGVWEFGRRYTKGAGVTVKGAWWIAQEDTTTRPGDGTPESSRAWRLAVKGGRDGKPGKDGKDAA